MNSGDAELRKKLVEIQVKLVELKKLCETRLEDCLKNRKNRTVVNDAKIASAAMDLAQVNAAIDVLK